VAVLCPELVGRDAERHVVRARVGDLAAGRGGVVVLLGEAGAGKSRLARDAIELATACGAAVLAGRSVPGASPVPYRPLTEALLGAFRGSGPPDDPGLEGFQSHLGRLVPAWRAGAEGAEESPVLLAEAIVRLLTIHGGDRGAILLLDDVHWADPETLAVVDYLADALRAEPVLCMATSRPGGAADDLIERLGRRDPAAVVRVLPLDEDGVEGMVSACLATATPPGEVVDFVQAHSDGSPFLVEELLAGLVASGDLRSDAGRWTSTGPLRATVPASLRESIRRRLDALTPDARRVLGAAAMLGRSFEWELLPGIAEVDGKSAVDGLRAAVQEQLIVSSGHGFTFRHALSREAVLAELLPPERRDLATRAWPALERAKPGLPGPALELAADLAEAAGDPIAAARHLIESARRALHAAALASAESTVRRAGELAAGDEATSADAAELLVRVLVAAGKPADALATARRLVDRLAAAEGTKERWVDLRILTARAALAAGDVPGAAADVGAARAAAGDQVAVALQARLDAVGASVAYDQADLDEADRLARAAVASAEETGQAAVQCEARLVLGQVVRTLRGMEAAVPVFQEAGVVAAAAGLAHLHLRAEHELAMVLWARGEVRFLSDVRTLAARYGALSTVAVMDLARADIALSSYDREACLEAATDCAEASRRYGLVTEPVAHLWLAGAHALGGDRAAMQASIDDALAADPDDPRILGDLYGRVLTTAAFVDDELERLPALLDTMIEHVRRAPQTTSVYPGRITWALVHTIDDDDLGATQRAEFTEAAERIGLLVYSGAGELIEAVAMGRAGDTEGATERFARGLEAMRGRSLGAGSLYAHALLAARAALRDGWGDPVSWLREAEAFFAAGSFDKLARRCRLMLGEAGAPMPRRGRGSEVPIGLRALGVTSREVDVLQLVAAGRSNKDIAAELFVSPKTVERHLSSLFARLGVANRGALAERAAPHLRDPAP
jgi:DNA-binding CsgD family transcriptional regulator